MKKNIYLIGFMGSGKTYLAKQLAERWNCPLMETDAEIERKEGMTIPEIFSRRGEEYFRKAETELLKTLKESGQIVSCGGGMALSAENIDLMRRQGIIVMIDAPFELCYGRILQNKDRPLAANRAPMELRELHYKRRMIYLMLSDETIDGAAELEDKLKELDRMKENNKW